ncbi:DUF3987 domain-containing protein [Mesorhizobium yinganensis]|uniref:DUF3987 domain-containing protein n=1 Tax=Mesorhizobium yinganensis TaxID=3157707 RepID=UPI003CCCC337
MPVSRQCRCEHVPVSTLHCGPCFPAPGHLSTIPDTVRLRIKRHDPSWHEPARLWVALVGQPSRKKTLAINKALEPINKINRRLIAQYQKERDDYETVPKEERAGTPKTKNKRLRISDATVEAVQDILKDNDTGLILVRDELSGLAGQHGRLCQLGQKRGQGSRLLGGWAAAIVGSR